MKVPTDDRPYQYTLDFSTLKIAPTDEEFSKPYYISRWTLVLRAVFFGLIVSMIFAAFYLIGRKEQKMPMPYFFYFLVTGMLYMFTEICLIGKFEIFVGNPLYSVAIVFFGLLLTNGIGSLMFDKFKTEIRIGYAAVSIGGFLLITIMALDIFKGHIMGLPLITRITLLMAVLTPTGMLLGLFYPYGVKRLIDKKLGKTVSMSYGISSLSSVLGSSIAVLTIISLGFKNMIIITSLGYFFLIFFIKLFFKES
jgi:hypothetical protein